MSTSLTSEPLAESAFVCDCKWWWLRTACAGEPFYKEQIDTEGKRKRYCVLHFPGKEKSADFEKALQKKLENKDFNFRGVWFPDPLSLLHFDFDGDVDFRSAVFSADVDISSATFSAKANFYLSTFSAEANFGSTIFRLEADFNLATFSEGANFSKATFRKAAHFGSSFGGEADFDSAKFNQAAHFGRTIFSGEANFHNAIFSAEAKFYEAKFSKGANFNSVNFKGATLFYAATFDTGTYFQKAIFEADALFNSTIFNAKVDFSSATFVAAASFNSATFSGDADFTNCNLSGKTDLSDVTFRDYVKFAGKEGKRIFIDTSLLDLQFARIEKPDHLSFHTLSLQHHWFVNVDARKFDFTNVTWDWRNIGEELQCLRQRMVSSPHRLLAIACRNLAVNAEENHRYEEASKFRYMAMDERRRENWHGFDLRRLSWWYWVASGYGEGVFQAFLVLLGIMLLSAVLYNHVGFTRWEPKLASESDVATAKRDDVGAPLKFGRAITYSAAVMTLQKPEPRPTTTAAQTVVLLETIFGPVQAALLALAIRRKFMR